LRRLLTKRQQPPQSDAGLSYLDIYGIHSFIASFCVEINDIAFTDMVNQTRSVYKNFLLGSVINDESKAFGFVEKLNSTCIHYKKINDDVAICRRKGTPLF